MANPDAQEFSRSFELSPIILTNGIVGSVVGGALPIISLLAAAAFPTGITGGGGPVTIDDAWAVFKPLPGAALINNQIGLYPFANQQTAANAIVTEPLGISFQMICPARFSGDYGGGNRARMTALQATLARHNIIGGTYTLVTPNFVWNDAVMTGMRDISGGETKQVQYVWQLDFIKPLVTLAEAQQAQNILMSKISAGAPINGQPAWSGNSTSPMSVQLPAAVPAGQAQLGGSIDAFGPTSVPSIGGGFGSTTVS